MMQNCVIRSKLTIAQKIRFQSDVMYFA
uniref:Uncharacterized protein n=1 Tax=Arundo donax TaxID=35708 RepID=A0A0A8YJQ0_ARUDO